jgi:hypothetical protein
MEGLLRIALVDLPCYAVYLALKSVLSGRFDFKWVGIATVVYGLSRLLAVAQRVGTGSLTVEAALVANVFASVMWCAGDAAEGGSCADISVQGHGG